MRGCLSRRVFLGRALVSMLSAGGVLATRRTAMSTDGVAPAASFRARRIARRKAFGIAATPQMIFPLLCPVREREWLENWKADVVYSDSGVAEENAIFTSEHPLLGEAVYVVSCHEPEQGRLGFTVFYPGTCVQQLEIELKPMGGGGTRLTWNRLFTGLSQRGNALIEQISEEVFEEQTLAIARALERQCDRLQAK